MSSLSSKDILIKSVRHNDNLSEEENCGGRTGWRDVLRVEGTFIVFPRRALVLGHGGERKREQKSALRS